MPFEKNLTKSEFNSNQQARTSNLFDALIQHVKAAYTHAIEKI